MWLFTNVLDSQQLSLETAGVYYRWRWENEGFFRTYKRTLKKVTLMSRTLRLVHREAEASMIATQLLLCQGALAMPVPKKDDLPVMCSPRGVLLEARRDIAGQSKASKPFTERIRRCATGTACAYNAEAKAGMASSQGPQATTAPQFAEAHQVTKSSNPQRVMRRLTHANGNGIECHPMAEPVPSGAMNSASCGEFTGTRSVAIPWQRASIC